VEWKNSASRSVNLTLLSSAIQNPLSSARRSRV
jgi:hypothetical protein